MRPAALARRARERAACIDRQRQEFTLPVRVSHRRAQTLVGAIVGAQRVAVHDQHRFAVKSDDQGVGQQLRAARAAELRRQQEIPVAVHDEAGHAARGERAQTRDSRGLCLIRRVVPHPGLEQIPEDVQRRRFSGFALQEI